MRCVIISFLIFNYSISFSQIGKVNTYENLIELGRVERYVGNTYALYTFSFIEVDSINNVYVLSFTNENTLYNNSSPDIRSVGFEATKDQLDYFFKFLLDGFDQKQIRTLDVGNHLVKTVPPSSKFLHIFIDFEGEDSASFRISKKQLARLFGRK